MGSNFLSITSFQGELSIGRVKQSFCIMDNASNSGSHCCVNLDIFLTKQLKKHTIYACYIAILDDCIIRIQI